MWIQPQRREPRSIDLAHQGTVAWDLLLIQLSIGQVREAYAELGSGQPVGMLAQHTSTLEDPIESSSRAGHEVCPQAVCHCQGCSGGQCWSHGKHPTPTCRIDAEP